MNRHLARTTNVPDDWRTTLAEYVPALRARRGKLPRPTLTGVLASDTEIEVCIPDIANDCTHSFAFDHLPSLGEIASCENVVFAPHN